MKKPAVAAARPVGREVVTMKRADLVVNPRNPRKHSAEQIERLMASLRTDGQTKPILVRRANNMIIAGHGVTEAAGRLGWEEMSVVLLDVTQAQADRIMLADNRQSDLSTSDDALVTELLRDIDRADWMATGFSDDEVSKLFAGVDAADLTVHEIDTSTLEDTFWISVRGPLADQALALARLKDLMGEMPKVAISLGTTDDLS